MPRLAALLFLSLIPLMAACALESDASPGTTPAPPQQPPAGAPQVPVFARPPAATASANGISVPMGIGTYCWSDPARNGVCLDAAGPITGTQELHTKPGERIDITTAFPGVEVQEAVAMAIAVGSAQGKPATNGDLVWNFPPIGGTQQPATVTAAGVSFPAPSQPGRYVINLFLRPKAGDVAYGVVLDVQ